MTHEPSAIAESGAVAGRTESFCEVRLDSAADLLDELAPHRGRLWKGSDRPEDERWIFRGQRDATWGLVPSALREGVLARFVRESGEQGPMSDEDRITPPVDTQLAWEQGLVNDFVIGLDRQGLTVPGDRPELRHYYRRTLHSLRGFPEVAQRPMFAIAQHYGVPTRLLDWSHNPKIAAYFACVKVAQAQAKEQLTPERFAVWALSQAFVEDVARESDPRVSIVTVPTVSNPNLHAQQGLFTLVEYREQPEELHSGRTPMLPSVDELVTESPPGRSAPLWKFSVPAGEAGVLLRLLALENVTAAQVFHGHQAVVEALHERAWHRWPSRR